MPLRSDGNSNREIEGCKRLEDPSMRLRLTLEMAPGVHKRDDRAWFSFLTSCHPSLCPITHHGYVESDQGIRDR